MAASTKTTVTAAVLMAATTMAASSTLIPSGISSNCSSYLTTLDSSSTMSSCITPLLTVANSLSSASTSGLTGTLSNLCASSVGCSDTAVRSQLNNFYAACSNDMSGSSSSAESVKLTYDVLYILNPLKDAICSKDASNNYCLLSMSSTNQTSLADSSSASGAASGSGSSASASASGSTTSAVVSTYNSVKAAAQAALSSLKSSVSRRDTASVPNASVFANTGLPFLFLTAGLPANQLCTFCARNVVAAYVAWEQQLPYQLGLSNSALLAGQNALWSGMTATCGTNYMNELNSIAGTAASTTSGAIATSLVSSGVAAVFITITMALLA